MTAFHRSEPGSASLFPKAPGLAKAMSLILVVVIDRIVLNPLRLEQRLRKPVPVLHRRQPGPCRVEDVHSRHVELRVVGGCPQPLLLSLVEHRPRNLRWCTEELDAVRTLLFDPTHPLAGKLGGRKRLFGSVSENDVRQHSRRSDLVVVAAVAMGHEPVNIMVADIRDRRDAMGHPQLVDVVCGHTLPRVVDVLVSVLVDKPKAGCTSPETSIFVTAIELRAVLGSNLRHRIANGTDLDDPVVLDDDVGGPVRRGTGAVVITVAPRRINRFQGPSPSARSGAEYGSSSWPETGPRR